MSVSKFSIKAMIEDPENKRYRKAKIIDELLNDQDHLLSTILVGNNLVNIGASSLTTSVVISIMGNDGIGVAVATGFVTLIILIFGEITPKTKATNDALSVCFKYCGFIRLLSIVFTPVVFMLTAISHFMIKITGGKLDSGLSITEEELKTIVNVSHEEGVLEDEEKEMIHNVFEFKDKEIKEIMTPRIHVTYLDEDVTYEEMIELLKDCQFSRIPVRSDEYDEIIGVLNIKDLLISNVDTENFDIKDYMRDPYFVYEFNHLQDTLEAMRTAHASIAIVLDEYGVMSGLVTLEDIVEEIVGEIDDEFDEEDTNELVKVNDHEFYIDGSLDIDEVNEKCGTKFSSEDFESIGGLILGEVNGSPRFRQEIQIDNCLFTIEKIDRNRIARLSLKILPAE